MAKWFEISNIHGLRADVEERLKLPPYTGPEDQTETAAEFWSRVERAGQLCEALALYDKLAADEEAWCHTRRERKAEFDARIEREGRRKKAERLRTKLLASGLSQREVQEELVKRMQPLDGTRTRVWETPDPWEAGRLFRRKRDQESLQELANQDDEERDDEAEQARWRIGCAQWRRDERVALAAARRRARELAEAAKKADKAEPAPHAAS